MVGHRVLGVNLTGVFLCGQVAARPDGPRGREGRQDCEHRLGLLGDHRRGRLRPTAPPGGGVRMLTKAMAVEARAPQVINVNCIGPGIIETGMSNIDKFTRGSGATTRRTSSPGPASAQLRRHRQTPPSSSPQTRPTTSPATPSSSTGGGPPSIRVHRLHRQRHVGVAAHVDHRKLRAALEQRVVHVQPRQLRHAHVEHQAGLLARGRAAPAPRWPRADRPRPARRSRRRSSQKRSTRGTRGCRRGCRWSCS